MESPNNLLDIGLRFGPGIAISILSSFLRAKLYISVHQRFIFEHPNLHEILKNSGSLKDVVLGNKEDRKVKKSYEAKLNMIEYAIPSAFMVFGLVCLFAGFQNQNHPAIINSAVVISTQAIAIHTNAKNRA